MKWYSSSPHVPVTKYPNAIIEQEEPAILETNYCRNSNNETEGPWCYTMDPAVRWQEYDVPLCQMSNVDQ